VFIIEELIALTLMVQIRQAPVYIQSSSYIEIMG